VDVAALLVDSLVNAAAFFLKQEEARKCTPQGLPVMEERRKGVCEVFEARVELHSPGGGNRTWSYRPIYDLLYSPEHDEWAIIRQRLEHGLEGEAASPKHTAMRWVHLPANNVKNFLYIPVLCH
jgi:hypothetical protein